MYGTALHRPIRLCHWFVAPAKFEFFEKTPKAPSFTHDKVMPSRPSMSEGCCVQAFEAVVEQAEAIAAGEEVTMARLDAGEDLSSMMSIADVVERVKRQLG